jgi:tetratricopeptide (TPR) repeat protein
MNNNSDFRFTISPIPEGEALTFDEMEERFLKQLKAKDGKCEQSLINLAQLYSQSDRVDEAFRCVEKLFELSDDPERHAGYYLTLGCYMEKIRDYKGAVRFYREALALEPCRPDVWYWIHNNLGYSLNQLQAYDDAMPYLRRAIEIDPQKPNAYKNLGLASQAIGHLEEAAKLFVRATQANATDARSLKHLEELMCAHPELEALLPELPNQVEACHKAVNMAKAHQPDFQAIWQLQRRDQEKAKDGRQSNEEITEALRLIDRMRDQLPIIASISNDADRVLKLLMTSGFPHLIQCGLKLVNLVKIGSENAGIVESMMAQAATVDALVGFSKRGSESPTLKPKVLEATAKMLQLFRSGLDQIEQALREKAAKTE